MSAWHATVPSVVHSQRVMSLTILKNASPLLIRPPSVADPDPQFRRVRESFTAELFLLLSREMRLSLRATRKRDRGPSLPSCVARSMAKLQWRVSSAREHLDPTARVRRNDNRPSRAHFSFKRRAARSARRFPRLFRFFTKRSTHRVPVAAPSFPVAGRPASTKKTRET